MILSAVAGPVGLQHAVTQILEGFDGQHQHPRFILDD